MSKTLEGKDGMPVDEIWIGVGDAEYRVKNTVEQPNGKVLIFEYCYHGEYDDGWVVQLSQEGKELGRWNIKFVTYIKWLT